MIKVTALIRKVLFLNPQEDEYDASCLEEVHKLQKKHEEFRHRIDQMKATLNGEDNWLLEIRKENGHGKQLPV